MLRKFCTPLFLVLALCLPAAAQLHSQSPIQLDSGPISGGATRGNAKLSVYKGIPYAAPPVGELRWKPPQPVAKWETVRSATEFGPVQPQRGRNAAGPGTKQSEDSLYLNVWTPASKADEKLPVMVWIHGGGFTYGSGSSAMYDGAKIAEQGVVLVSFNYRLNVLSGLALPQLTKESPKGISGNYGMLDQIAALEWVQRNIAAFGGNPDNVTIFGESAGGLSVCALMCSPLSKGLFHRAIVESGSTNPVGTLQAAERTGEQFVRRAGLASDDPDLLKKLRAKSWEDLPEPENFRGGPILDGYYLTDQPLKMAEQGKQHKVPMIVGYNRDEATFFNRGPVPQTVEEFRSQVNRQYGAAANQLLELYPAKTDGDVYWAHMNLATDAGLGVSAPRQLRGMWNADQKVWFYYFTHLTPGPQSATRGVSHASELSYVFGTLSANVRSQDRAVSDGIIGYWTQFAKTGDPNKPGLPAWPAFEKGNEGYLDIGDTMKAGKDLKKEKIDLLQGLNR